MSQALYRKWRPQTWTDVVGQGHVTQTLQNALRSGRVVHAYLFAGPRGTGKTSTARLLAKAINCLEPDAAKRPCNACEICQAVNQGRFLDLIEIDAASNTSVDDVRDLRDKINFSPSQGAFKVYIIDEVHMLSTAAFNALLKTLEEPPPHAIFILATTEIHKIPATVLSRCQRHEFRRIAVSDIVQQLEEIAIDEDLKVEPAVLTLIARQSTGAMRDAISLLDQLAAAGSRITLDFAHRVLGTATSQAVIDVVEALLQRDTAEGLHTIHTTLDSGTDPRQFARQLVEYLRSLLLVQMGSAASDDLTAEMRAQVEKHAHRFGHDHLLFCLQRFHGAAADTRSNWQPNLPLELAFAECLSYTAPAAAEPRGIQPAPGQPPARDPSPEKPPARAPESASKAPAAEKLDKTSPPQPESAVKSAAPQPEHAPRAGAGAGAPAAAADRPPQTGQPAREPTGRLSLKAVRQHWDEIRQKVRSEKPMTEALLNSCVYISVKNDQLVLGFASEVVKSKMETRENLGLVAPIISALLGTDVSIRCIVVDKKSNSSMDADLDANGMVNAALGLGGQIIEQE